MTNSASSPVFVTAPLIKYPFPLLSDISTERPTPTLLQAKCGQITSAVSLHKGVVELDRQIDSLGEIVNFFADHLDDDHRETIELEADELETRIYSLNREADYQLKRGVKYLAHAMQQDHFSAQSHALLLEKIDATIATLDFSSIEQTHKDAHAIVDWERDVNDRRRAELEAKQEMVDVYRDLLRRLHPAYLAQFYVGYSGFLAHSQSGAIKVLEALGALNFHHGFLDNKVEILIGAEGSLPKGTHHGMIAVNIGGVVYRRSPAAWDICSKAQYVATQEVERGTTGYVLALTEDQKQTLLHSICRKIQRDEKYSVIDHSCSEEVVAAFDELGINIDDPCRASADLVSPTAIGDFLRHSDCIIGINEYPHK